MIKKLGLIEEEEDIFKVPKIKKLGLIKEEEEDIFKPEIGIGAKPEITPIKPEEERFAEKPSFDWLGTEKQINTMTSELKSYETNIEKYNTTLTDLSKQIDTVQTELKSHFQTYGVEGIDKFKIKESDLISQYNSIIGESKSLYQEYDFKHKEINKLIEQYNANLPTIETKAGVGMGKVLGVKPETERIQPQIKESKAKDIFDAFRLGASGIFHKTKQYFSSALPNLIFADIKPEDREFYYGKETDLPGYGLSDEQIDKMNKVNEEKRAGYKEKYQKAQDRYVDWLREHPELKPRKEWEKGVIETIKENPKILADPAYWLYVAAQSSAFTIGVMGTVLTTTAVTGNPLLGLATGVLVAIPMQSQELYEDLIANGATPEQATKLAIPIGGLIASVEVMGDLPILASVSAPFKKLLFRNINKAVANRVGASLIKKGIRTFATIEVAETIEEVVQLGIQEATVKTVNENIDMLENIPETVIHTMIATVPFALVGLGSETQIVQQLKKKITDVNYQNAVRVQLEEAGIIPRTELEVMAYELPKLTTKETKEYLIKKGIRPEHLTPEFMERFMKKPEIQELAREVGVEPGLPEFLRREITEPTEAELAKIEAEKPLLEEAVTVDLVKEAKVEALWEGEDIGGTSEEITEGTLKAFDKTSEFLFNKSFEELSKTELKKVLETSKRPLPDSTGEYINKIGTPAKGLGLSPMADEHAMFIFGGYEREQLTDSHLLVLDKDVSKKTLSDLIEKYKKARIKQVQSEEISYKEAQKIVDKEVEGYKKEFVKKFPKTEDIVTKEAIGKATPLWIQGHQKISDYMPTITFLTDGKIQIGVDTDKLAFLNKHFPNAEIKTTGENKPIIFMEKGNLKAVVMPVRIEEAPFKITGEPTIEPKKIEKPLPKKLKDDYLKIIGREVDLTTDHLELVEDIRHNIPISERLQTRYPDLMKRIPEAKFAEIEVKPTIKKLAKVKPTIKPTITPEEKAERGRLIKKIHTIKSVKGLTDKEYLGIKQKIKAKFNIPWVTLTRMNVEQLTEVSKSMERARPKRIGYEKVVTLKTEKKIQSLKDSLMEKYEMTEEVYQDTLKDLHIFKEPKYIDGKHFITEEKGKELIYRLIDESNILKITEPLRIALEKNPEAKKLADVIDRRIKLEGERTLKDPSDLNSARSYFQILGTIADAPFFTLYQDLINCHLENRAGLNHLIEGFDEYRDVIKSEKALKRVEDWILSKSNLKDKPKMPTDMHPFEIKLAKKIEGILKGYQSRARTEKFLDNLENLEKMPEYLKYKKEIDKAKDIYESKGYDELVKYLETQKWGVIRSGYDPLQVVSARIRIFKAKGLSIVFGKEHIKVRKDIEYKEQDTNVITRVIAYKRQMDNLSAMAPKVRALVTLANKNLDKFKNPARVKSNLQLFFRELKGYDRSTNWFERGINRIYAQAMITIIMGSPPLSFRNLGQNFALGHDKAMLVDPRNKKLTPDDIVFLDTHVQQAIFMRTDWFMTGEKPLPGLALLTNIIKKINLYPRSDVANRHWGFWGKINQVRMAFADIDKNSTSKEISKAMQKAKFSDFSLLEQKRALEILSKDGKEAMERYVAKVYVDDVHFLYERAQRSLAEMGRYGRVFGNLMLFPRAYWEKLTKHSKKMTGKYVPIKERIRAFKVIASILIGGALVGVAYTKTTGRRKPPYDPLILLAYQTGGLMIGTVDALNDVYVETINAIRGDKRALATLTSSVPALADHLIPFYNYMLRGYEAFLADPLVNKNIDVYALKKLRQLIDKEYEIRGGVHSVERNALEKWQYFLSGAGVDVAIAERKRKEREAEPIKIGEPKIKKLGIPKLGKPGIKKLSPIRKF